jgi:hypothetical protein
VNLLEDWRDAALAVADLSRTDVRKVGDAVLGHAGQLARRLDALLPLHAMPDSAPVPVRGYTAEAQTRVGRFIEATDAAVTGRYEELEAEVGECLTVARCARPELESFALLAAPVIETNALGLFFSMVVQSGAAEQRLTPSIIRALEAAQETGVEPSAIDAMRAGRPLTPRIVHVAVEVATLVRIGIPLEFATAMVGEA